MIKKMYKTPAGKYYTLFSDMLKQNHLLIAGTTGSGKSVIINGIISTALYTSPAETQFILIDPKMTELVEYKHLPHVITYATEPVCMRNALQLAINITMKRAAYMQKKRLKIFDGSNIYVVIDELADLLTVDAIKRDCKRLLQRLCQIGRACRVHVIGATQRPTNDVIGNAITVNMDARVALRTRNAQESRNIIGLNGCEQLPKYGKGYYMTADGITLYNIPYIDDATRAKLVQYWEKHKRPKFYKV